MIKAINIWSFPECIERGEQPSIVTPNDARESVRTIDAEIQSKRAIGATILL